MKDISCLMAVAYLLLATSALAEGKCSSRTIHARYGVTCQGSVSTSPGVPLAPYALMTTCTGNANAFFKCTGTQSFDGTVVPSVAQGPASVNSDCTGKITFDRGTPQELDFNFLILHDGEEIRGMLQNPGSAVQCDLIRMSDLEHAVNDLEPK